MNHCFKCGKPDPFENGNIGEVLSAENEPMYFLCWDCHEDEIEEDIDDSGAPITR